MPGAGDTKMDTTISALEELSKKCGKKWTFIITQEYIHTVEWERLMSQPLTAEESLEIKFSFWDEEEQARTRRYLALPKYVIVLAQPRIKPYSAKRHRFSQVIALIQCYSKRGPQPKLLLFRNQKNTEVSKLETFVPIGRCYNI